MAGSRPGALAVLALVAVGLAPQGCFFDLHDPVPRRDSGASSGGSSATGGTPPNDGSVAGGTQGLGGAGGARAGMGGTGATDGGGPCPGSMKRCAGACVRTNDPAYGCSANDCTACPQITTAATMCSAGACTVTACLPGFGDCNGSDADGCEIEFAKLPHPTSPPPDSIVALHVSGAIDINGFASEPEWANIPRQPIGAVCANCSAESPIPRVFDTTTAPPPEDLSAWFRTAWDDNFLYAFFEVRDDQFVDMPRESDVKSVGTLGNSVVEDAVELLISTDHSIGGYGVDDMQLYFGLDETIGRTNQPAPTIPNAMKVKKGRGCYSVELKMSFGYLSGNKDYTPVSGHVMGFTAAVDDWDYRKGIDGGMVPEFQSHLFSKNPGDGYWVGTDGFANLTLLIQ